MKKLLLVLVAVFCLTGCGEKVVCTTTQDIEGAKLTGEITAPVKDGKVSSAKALLTAEFKSEKLAKEYYESIKDEYDNVKRNGKKVTAEEKEESGNEKIKKADFIKSMKAMGYKCK